MPEDTVGAVVADVRLGERGRGGRLAVSLFGVLGGEPVELVSFLGAPALISTQKLVS